MKKWTGFWLFLVVGIAFAEEEKVIGSFEDDDQTAWKHGEISTDQAKGGTKSFRFGDSNSTSGAVTFRLPKDLTPWSGLKFWLYSQNSNGQKMAVILDSPNPETPKLDYYFFKFKVDWQGWKEFSIPFSKFTKMGAPLGMDQIKFLCVSTDWFNTAEDRMEGTLLYLDEVRLEP